MYTYNKAATPSALQSTKSFGARGRGNSSARTQQQQRYIPGARASNTPLADKQTQNKHDPGAVQQLFLHETGLCTVCTIIVYWRSADGNITTHTRSSDLTLLLTTKRAFTPFQRYEGRPWLINASKMREVSPVEKNGRAREK